MTQQTKEEHEAMNYWGSTEYVPNKKDDND